MDILTKEKGPIEISPDRLVGAVIEAVTLTKIDDGMTLVLDLQDGRRVTMTAEAWGHYCDDFGLDCSLTQEYR